MKQEKPDKNQPLEVLVLKNSSHKREVEKYIHYRLEDKFGKDVKFMTFHLFGNSIFSGFNFYFDLDKWGKLHELEPRRFALVVFEDDDYLSESVGSYLSTLRELNPSVRIGYIDNNKIKMIGFPENWLEQSLREKYGFKGSIDHLNRVEALDDYIADMLKSREK